MECSSKEMTGVHEIFDTAIDSAVRGGLADLGSNSSVPGSRNGGGGGNMTMLNGAPVRRKKSSNCRIL